MAQDVAATEPMPLECFACPNPECDSFNRFGAGNLTVCERMGKNKAIRRLYCRHCGHRFSERRGSLMQDAKLPLAAVVRMVPFDCAQGECLTHGCSLEATADICDVDPRTVAKLLDRAGPRSEEFHRQQLAKLERPPAAVEMDELHARVASPPASAAAGKKGGPRRAMPSPRQQQQPRPGLPVVAASVAAAVARWVATGSTPPWQASRAS